MSHRLIPGPGGQTLQDSYNRSAAIITGANGPVALSRVLDDAQHVLTLNKSPATGGAGSALDITMGANTTDVALKITNLGSGPDISWGNNRLEGGSLILEEKGAALAFAAGLGQIYVKNDAPNSLWFANDVGTEFRLDVPLMSSVGTPTYTSLQDGHDILGSSGVIAGGGITDDADGTITVAAGSGFIRATNDEIAEVLSFDWTGANVALADNDMNYVYVEYNAGSPQVIATATKRADLHTNVLLATVYRIGTTLHISEANHRHIANGMGNLISRFVETEPFERGDGGIIGETGTRNFSLTAGSWWHGLDSFSTSAFDSSGADTFTYIYQDGVGGWTSILAQSQINNTQYDDGTGTLATLANNQYGVHWVCLGQDGDLFVSYGLDSYTLLEAQSAELPGNLPPWFAENHARLVGRIIILKSASAFTLIESPFTSTFAGGAPTDHGGLIGLGDDDHTQYLLIDGTRAMTGGLTVNADIDTTTILGRARIDSRLTDFAYLAHFDQTSTSSYALRMSSTGQTALASSTGQSLFFSIGPFSLFSMQVSGGNRFRSLTSGGPALLTAAGSDSQATLIANGSDLTSGVGGASGTVALITGSTAGLIINATQDAAFAGDVSLDIGSLLVFDADGDAGLSSLSCTADNQLFLKLAGSNKFRWQAGDATSFENFIVGGTGIDASAGSQVDSAIMAWKGSGWKTNATASAQNCTYEGIMKPIQGAANPTSTLELGATIENVSAGAFDVGLTLSWDGIDHAAVFTGDLDAAGGFRRHLGNVLYTNIGTSATVQLTNNNADEMGWFCPARAGSVVEIACWDDGDVTAGQVGFFVDKSTDGGDTWSALWGSSGSPILLLDTTDPETNTATQAKDTSTFVASDLLRIRATSDGSFAQGGTRILAAITIEC